MQMNQLRTVVRVRALDPNKEKDQIPLVLADAIRYEASPDDGWADLSRVEAFIMTTCPAFEPLINACNFNNILDLVRVCTCIIKGIRV